MSREARVGTRHAHCSVQGCKPVCSYASATTQERLDSEVGAFKRRCDAAEELASILKAERSSVEEGGARTNEKMEALREQYARAEQQLAVLQVVLWRWEAA